MRNILISGATGNVGIAIIKKLSSKEGDFKILAAERKPHSQHEIFQLPKVEAVYFDFEDLESIKKALELTSILFLLRPPQLADVRKYFEPIIEQAKNHHLQHIVFLSVQGAGDNSMIPHHKIEKLIENSGINYTFLRPAYFMQNFTTTLKNDIVENNLIYLPAGKAKFTLIDVEEVGTVGAEILANPSNHINQAYDLTNDESLTFGQMATILSEVLGRKIRFKSPNLISFYLKKRKEKIPAMFTLVMIMLHYLPRFKPTPPTSGWVEKITGKKAKSFREFALANQSTWTPAQ